MCAIKSIFSHFFNQALVHVSTAYSNAPRSQIEEMVYPPPYDPDTIIRCTKMLPAETMDVIGATLQVSISVVNRVLNGMYLKETNMIKCNWRPLWAL
jgi:hypothetical protein